MPMIFSKEDVARMRGDNYISETSYYQILAERDRLAAENAELRKINERLDYAVNLERAPNRNPARRGAFEFYVCENWMFIRDCALDDENVGMNACITKRRDDPDDERVRIRRIRDDDALLEDLAAANAAHAQLVIDYEQVLADLEASDATLDALRDAVHPDERRSWSALDAVHAILYPQPKETTDDEQ